VERGRAEKRAGDRRARGDDRQEASFREGIIVFRALRRMKEEENETSFVLLEVLSGWDGIFQVFESHFGLLQPSFRR
jgi:hypothetical protein